MKIRRNSLLVLFASLALNASTCSAPKPVVAPVTHSVVCTVQDAVTQAPIQGAVCYLNGAQLGTDAAGHVVFTQVPQGSFTLKATDAGYADGSTLFTNNLDNQYVTVSLKRNLPVPPTRTEFLNLHITFQGLTADCAPYGQIPVFEAVLAWATPACRQSIYAAKHASTAWGPGGDTHALIQLPFGLPLYDEPNQPYSADRFGTLDWTAGDTQISSQLADLVVEVLNAGFNRVIIVEGGDGSSGPTDAPYKHAMAELPLLHQALSQSKYGDLTPYVGIMPGWDGVFYGWEPSATLIPSWVSACRSQFQFCVFETSTGHIPLGEGGGDWVAGGDMTGVDLLLQEFNDDQYDDTVWQIAARELGPKYHRPADEPSGDDPTPAYYFGTPTPRGPVAVCAFEFHEYTDVHSNGGAVQLANTVKQRQYLQAVGYPCGG